MGQTVSQNGGYSATDPTQLETMSDLNLLQPGRAGSRKKVIID